jgi:hypothetical protein
VPADAVLLEGDLTVPPLSDPIAPRQWRHEDRAGWLARLPGGIVAALRVALIYGETERLCPPASAWRAGRGDQFSSPPRRREQRLARS